MFLIPKSYYEVRKTKDRGRGVFATTDISGGTVIGDYLGIAKRPKDLDERVNGLYDMYITEELSILGERNKDGIHLINHACTPNCNMEVYNHHVLYYASRKISKDEEITVDYSIGGFEDENYPCTHECFCGSPLCRGTMHNAKYVEDRWDKIYEKSTKTATLPLRYEFDKPYQPLPSYPKIVRDDPMLEIFANPNKPAISYKDSQFPTTKVIRARIRETGRVLKLPKLKITIWGILNNHILVKSVK